MRTIHIDDVFAVDFSRGLGKDNLKLTIKHQNIIQIIFFLFLQTILLCVWVFACIYMYVHHVCAMDVRWGHQIPWNWNSGSLWDSMWVLGQNPGPQQEQQVLLVIEPCLQLLSYPFLLIFFFFKTGSYYIAMPGLELIIQSTLALDSESSCFCLPSVRTKGLCHHGWLFLLL